MTVATTQPSPADVPAIPRKRSRLRLTRSQAAVRRRRIEELGRGRWSALRHGAFAVVLAQPDIFLEVELVFAAHPSLDRIRDARLVEAFATSAVMRQRALLAIEHDGMTPTLTAYESRLAGQVERGEQRVHDREQLRKAEALKGAVTDLSKFRPREVGS